MPVNAGVSRPVLDSREGRGHSRSELNHKKTPTGIGAGGLGENRWKAKNDKPTGIVRPPRTASTRRGELCWSGRPVFHAADRERLAKRFAPLRSRGLFSDRPRSHRLHGAWGGRAGRSRPGIRSATRMPTRMDQSDRSICRRPHRSARHDTRPATELRRAGAVSKDLRAPNNLRIRPRGIHAPRKGAVENRRARARRTGRARHRRRVSARDVYDASVAKMKTQTVWDVIVPGKWACEHEHPTAADAFACLDCWKRQRDALGLRYPLQISPKTRETTAA